ncbi:MAG: sigma-54 dependent transcriptional regulator [Melioribacteraceae bacterium]|nr:sigma-54 dependent transcriptional regulator [Melioribacteraceae bacterium]MCF8356110.1 sigma-54 dependent transcriptional regulator [Melioribacteraceae bacterium]MCF8395594.1 sigma-54 dependent transcriptional regulator [Melioribacteraceae bacterium]MCF8419696.1 sigma-54 dependent transcriptional regulator [Melioribacteraceae bacterium]
MYRNSRLLIVDDDETLCYLLKEELLNEGFFVDIIFEGKKALDSIKSKNYDLILLDLQLKDSAGEDILQSVKEIYPTLQVIILTAKSETRTAIECIKLGAYDFITKPYDFEQLLFTINRALEHKDLIVKNKLLATKVGKITSQKIIGESRQIKDVILLSEKAAKSDSNILLQGETGTGKELFAEFIHQSSHRSEKPMVAINCASLPDQLIESELFGYEKGAFTDAKTSKQGLVEIADGGTLFLDEIGELSLTLQPKLLRFLEKGEFRRVGGVANLKSDVRVIGATNKNLMVEAEQKNFRRDLLFRLNVITLTVPPLRERHKDINLLAKYFLEKKSPVRSPKRLSVEAERELINYSFPGNVRELEHVIERSIIFSDGDEIKPKDLKLPKDESSQFYEKEVEESSGEILSLEEIERVHIKNVLNMNDWNRENSARALGISQKTLYSKIKKYDLK